jgi:hypothetical protein
VVAEAAEPEDGGDESRSDEREPAAAPLPRSAGAQATQLPALHTTIVDGEASAELHRR